MKQLLTPTTMALMGLLSLVAPAQANVSGTEYFVSPDGNDVDPGTVSEPFATISHCASLAQAGDSCLVRQGVYRETISPAHSGTPEAPITFKPYKDEAVLVSGADVIDGFDATTGGRYRAELPVDMGVGANQIFVDGTMLWEARYPNANADVMSSMSGQVTNPVRDGDGWRFEDPGLPSGLDGAKVNILPGPEWVAETGTVTASQTGSITITAPYGQLKDPFYELLDSNPYMVWGSSKLLDDPSEFFHDSEGSIIEIMVDPAEHLVEAKARDFAFVLNNRSHIIVEGFDTFAATITTGDPAPDPAELSIYPQDASASFIELNHLSMRYVSHFTLIPGGSSQSGEGVFEAWNMGMTNSGVMLFGSNNRLTNSAISYSAGNGITLAGQNHVVSNNTVHDVDYSVTDGAALSAGFLDYESSGHVVSQNSFHRSARSIVTLRGATALELRANDLYDAGLVAADLGIVYTYQTDGLGTIIADNWVHGNQRDGDFIGIYLDNDSRNFTITNNLVWDVTKALQLNLPSLNNTVSHNTLIGSPYALSAWAPPEPDEGTVGSTLSDNILIGERTTYGRLDTLNLAEEANYESTAIDDPGFSDVAQPNLGLTSNAAAAGTGASLQTTPGAAPQSQCSYGDLGCNRNYGDSLGLPGTDSNSSSPRFGGMTYGILGAGGVALASAALAAKTFGSS